MFAIRFILLLAAFALSFASFPSRSTAQVTRSFTEPVERSDVAAAEPGVINKVLVREGQRVTTGQPLAELDNQVLNRSLDIAILRANSDARSRSAASKLKVRKQQLEKLLPLLDAGHANNAEVEQARAEFEAAAAELELANEEADEFQLEVARIQAQINRRIIYSPIDGWITEIHHQPGEYIASTNPQFATVVKLNQLRARFYLLADVAEHLRAGQPIEIAMDELAMDNQSQNVNAIVEFVSPVTDPDSGTARVDLLIDNPKMKFRSGTPCRWIDMPAGASNLR